MGEDKYQPTYDYSSVNPSPEQQLSEDASMRPKIELGNHPQMAKKRGWVTTIMWQIFAVLWMVPIIVLLYLNFTEHIIGASAWCPRGQCWLNTFNPVTAIPQERAKLFDKQSHNLLGGLQFVAKGLEIWFGIIAAAVMYLVTMDMAGKREGLPVGYLTRPMEFADIITILDPLLWKTGPSPFGPKSAAEKRIGRRVWYLVALSIFLCILINLMGPATAVLVIPALQWIETPKFSYRQFEQLNAALPPQTNPDSWYWWETQQSGVCTEGEINALNYSCTQTAFGDSLDSWFSSYYATGGAGYTTQSNLVFSVNSTSISTTTNSLTIFENYFSNKQNFRDYVWWVPSRQMLSDLSTDLLAVQILNWGFNETVGDEWLTQTYNPDPIKTYAEYNKSLELTVLRDGPITGTIPMMWFDYNSSDHWVVEVDADRQVRCYNDYNLVYGPLVYSTFTGTYTKCIRTGNGWSPENKMARFYTEQYWDNSTQQTDPGVDITVYTSDKAAFFPNGDLPSWLPKACLEGGSLLNRTICDWDRIFTTDPSSEIYNRTQHITTIEFLMSNTSGYSTNFVVDFVAFQDFTQYTLDCNPVSNPLLLVQTGDLPTTAPSFPIDPNWYLAAWSVGEQYWLLPNRTSTMLLQEVMQYQLQNPDQLFNSDKNQDYVALIPILQTLSLIDHTTTATTAKKSTDPEKPLLQRWSQMYVWCYGITSRTAYLGAAVAIAGCLVVVWHFVIGFTDRRRYRSPTQLLVAALEHSPRGEFEGKGHDELAMARVRFHIKDNDLQAGKYSFYEPDATAATPGTTGVVS